VGILYSDCALSREVARRRRGKPLAESDMAMFPVWPGQTELPSHCSLCSTHLLAPFALSVCLSPQLSISTAVSPRAISVGSDLNTLRLQAKLRPHPQANLPSPHLFSPPPTASPLPFWPRHKGQAGPSQPGYFTHSSISGNACPSVCCQQGTISLPAQIESQWVKFSLLPSLTRFSSDTLTLPSNEAGDDQNNHPTDV
jgi:hypothetical protein